MAAGPLVVDASGGGDYTTIQAAVDAAADGDESSLVRPGAYAESVTIEEKDITLRGDGPVEEIVVESAEETFFTLFTLNTTDAEVANLTLRGNNNTQGMTIAGGAPTITGVVFDDVGVPYESGEIGQGGSLQIAGGSAQVLDNRFVGGGEISVHQDADVVMEGNEFRDGPHLYLEDPGDDAIVRGNTFSGTYNRAMGLFGESTMLIEGNVVEGAGGDGITVGWNSSPGMDSFIRDNDISGARTGIMIYVDANPVVEGNRLHGNDTGIVGGEAVSFTGNEVSGSRVGMQLRGSPTLDGNTVADGSIGIMVSGEDSTPSLSNNRICGNEQNVLISEQTNTPPLEADDTNEICEDPPAE